VLTEIDPVPPDGASVIRSGDTEYVQPDPDCVTVVDWPAIVKVPAREVAFVFVPTEKLTLPAPLLLALEVIVIQLTLLTAVHPHPSPADTPRLPLPPTAEKVPGGCETA
jgi:hypothetical protein